ncbi:MAG: type I secretion protein [Rhodobacteraceae bacterium]|nr:type I secretion protein [Paracoccaceae bacterium]
MGSGSGSGVDGEATGEQMGLGYNDANAPTNGGGDIITNGNDLIYGNGGDDTIDGEGGDDTIYGDSGTSATSSHEIFQWEDAPNFGDDNTASGFTQDTGSANITFSIDSSSSGVTNNYETDDQNTDDLDASVDENASFESVLNGNSNSATYSWTSDAALENVEFRVNDIDGDGRIVVRAWDSDGNPIEVTLSDAGYGLSLSDSDGVSGNDTATSIDDNYTDDDTAQHSVLVTIQGPVSHWQIQHEQDGSHNTGVNVTDITFDTVGTFGDPGDDQITGGDGSDDMFGEDGDDTFFVSSASEGDGDVIVGGNGPDDTADDDVLDLRGAGLVTITSSTDSSDDGALTGTVTFASGETLEFSQIETILTDPQADGAVDGEEFGEVMELGYDDSNEPTDQGGDIITDDGDTIYGNGGNDYIDGEGGDDTIDGGKGDDTIYGNDGCDTVTDTSGNNVIDTSGNSPLPDIGFPAYGPLPEVTADGDPDDDRDSVVTGSGNDHITTGDDADTIVSGSGNDTIDSGIDDDVIEAYGGADLVVTGEGNDSVLGGSGNDTIYGGTGYPGDPINIPDAGPGYYGPDPVPGNGMDTLDGGTGHDLIYGEDDADLIYGGAGGGADTLYGGVDNDTIFGGAGKDNLIGGEGADSMVGGADRDEFLISSREDAFGDVIDGSTTGTDIDTLDLRGLGRMEVVNETDDADGDSTSGTVNFLDTVGNIEGSLTFSEIENLYICFTPGTRIATPRGEVAVQDLRAGDRVITRDDGVQEIHWIGKKKLLTQDLIKDPSLRPVLIKKGALGNGLPERDMMVSPNHRMLVANGTTHMLFDEREVLVAAKLLTGQPGIHQIDTLGTEYIHLLFERHEVILGDGAWTESFQPGDYSLAGMDPDQLDEITKLFPDLQRTEGRRAFGAARQSLKAHEARMLRESMGAN